MALKLRRGTDAQRLLLAGPTAPAQGELIFTTDTKKLYVGDGSTPGGIPVDTSGSGASSLGGLTDVNLSSPTIGQFLSYDGSVWSNSNLSALTDIVQDLSPQLGANLDVNGHTITTSISNGDLTLQANASGKIIINGDLEVNGNIVSNGGILKINTNAVILGDNNSGTSNTTLTIIQNSFGPGIFYNQHHDLTGSNKVSFYRSRGNVTSPSPLQIGDMISDISMFGRQATDYSSCIRIITSVDGPVVGSNIPTKLSIRTNNGMGLAPRVEITNNGYLVTDNIGSLSGTALNVLHPLALKVYTDSGNRDSVITSPILGMICITGTQLTYYNGSSWTSL